MKLQNQSLRLSASDISNHLGCRHLTTLNHRFALGQLERPPYRPATEVLQQRGMEHERAYIEHLRAQGTTVLELPETGNPAVNREATLAAMHQGIDAIAQATFFTSQWFGRADVLLKVPSPSALGPWSYEVADTKLSQTTKAGTILQLCLYSELLGETQGLLPRQMHVIVPRREFEPETYRVKDYLAYHRLVGQRLAEAVQEDPTQATTYPTPTAHCDICQWWKSCDQRRRRDDHLCLVAGLGRDHETQLREWQLPTLTALANHQLPLPRPDRGSPATYEKLHRQAHLQLKSRDLEAPLFELLEVEPDRGFCRLPRPSEGDIFLDLEGDAFVEPSGLEYVIGWIVEEGDQLRYKALWSYNDAEEYSALDQFMTFAEHRLRQYPDLHIYHYAPYEPAAFKRMMGKHALHEEGVDRLLRGKKFIDLYAVVRQGLRAGIERYSIKDLEPLYQFERDLPLREASTARFVVEKALEMRRPQTITADRRTELEAYNRDDCVSTLRLRDWLEDLRQQQLEAGALIPRPDPSPAEASEALTEHQQKIEELRNRLLDGVPPSTEDRNEESHARWLLAHLLDWFRREKKVTWWEFFRLADLSHEERLEDPKALGGLQFMERFTKEKPATKKCPVDRYRFPVQDVDPRDKEAWLDRETPLGKSIDFEPARGFIDIKKSAPLKDTHPDSIFLFGNIRTTVIENALYRFAEWVADHGIDTPGPYRAGRDLLLRNPPRGLALHEKALLRSGEELAPGARRIALELDRGVLPVQGPPGAGKTYTGARMVVELVRQGKKVGITALGHNVIRNLLDEVVLAAQEEDVYLKAVQKVADDPSKEAWPIRETTKNKAVANALRKGHVDVAAGTAWLWSREEMAEAVDVLVVDEAGQMSLAMTLAVSQGAKSLILIGDPQQLEQPVKGTHPEGTEAAALDHLLGDRQTVPPDRGLFLHNTWRLHPELCSYTSEMFYEDRLEPRPGLEKQRILGPAPLTGDALAFLPVPHRGHQSSSPEEVEAIATLVEHTLGESAQWVDQAGQTHPLTLQDILIVAPYNAQVMLLSARLPHARIGTVDKFQGQEAPWVIYSMTTSSPEEAPRGMEFLYSRNRLNVATSRARCLALVVGSPSLLEPDCRTPRQIELANALCRFRELSPSLTWPPQT